MNTRLQVEHPVTEMTHGVDLVELQLRVAAGEPLPARQEDIRFQGHAIEVRLCAEDPQRNFLPQAGRLVLWQPSATVRVDHALDSGTVISPYYDSMIAKLIAHAPTRDEARATLAAALDETIALGVPTNKEFLSFVLRNETFGSGQATTRFVEENEFKGDKPDYVLAANLLAGDYGEWTGWSNNPSHQSRVRFGEEILAFTVKKAEHVHVVEGDTVHFSGFTLRNSLYDPPQKKGAGASDGRLVAPMNGRVVEVNAKVGETVAAHKALVVLEAMKMEHGLDFSFAVKIKAIHIKAGAQVSPGNLLVEFEPA
jgi:geranyl-CoA carboxylase alpha subunit